MSVLTWPSSVIGDEIGSWFVGTKPVILNDGIEHARGAIVQVGKIALTVQQARQVADDLQFLAGEVLKFVVLEGLKANPLVPLDLGPDAEAALDRALDRVSPLTIVVLDLVAEAIADLSPEEQGHILGLVVEAVVEGAAISAATEGVGAVIESAAFQARVAKILEASSAFANSKPLQALVKALKEVKVLGRTAEQIAEDLKNTIRGTRAVWAEILDHCFAAGTPILTPTGEKAIELFEVGDEILTRPEDSPDAPLRTSAVEKVFRLSGYTFELRIGGRMVTTTDKHPFYVVGRGWTWAGHLVLGDQILGHDGTATAVESIAQTGRLESLYNLRVATDRTYFVGSREWGFSLWAHNRYLAKFVDGKWIVEGLDKDGNAFRALTDKEIDELLRRAGKEGLTDAQARAEAAAEAANKATGRYRGGRHGQTSAPPRDGLESHHVPADSVNGLHIDDGPAIQMDPWDHARTASNGKTRGSHIHRARQKKLIEQGRFGAAIQMDIDDIRSKFGIKYDQAIKEMLDSLEPWMKVGLRDVP